MHYICKGTCKGVSETPGVCQLQDCPKYHEPLEACECLDGTHGEVLDREKEEEQPS